MTDSKPLLTRWVNFCGRYPLLTLSVTLLIAVASGFIARSLTINTNQLEMLDAEAHQVQDIKRVADMIGGTGRLTLALRGHDSRYLKHAAIKLTDHLRTHERTRIRSVNYRLPTDFILERAPLFMETADLIELRRRVGEKLADVKRRADPFFLDLEGSAPVELKVDDLLDKYGRVGKKSVADDFFLSAPSDETPGYMVLLHIKPIWDSNELELTGQLVRDLRQWLTTHQLTYPQAPTNQLRTERGDQPSPNDSSVTLSFLEDYSVEPNAQSQVIEFGFTGTYQTNYDDSFQIKDSLAPVSIFAFVGVLCSLLIFFGRRLFSIFLILSGLLLGLVITFGWAALTIGELNMITSILGGILMGLGIDFGIHLLYRFRDELSRHTRVEDALSATLKGAGFASLISGLGTIAAFASLLTSDFKGFSQFGFLAGSGVLLIGLTMYLWVPALVMWVERGAPGRARRWLGASAHQFPSDAPAQNSSSSSNDPSRERSLPRPLWIVVLSGGIALALSALAPQAPFEFNTRALMIEGIPSVQLQDELSVRFSQATDPVVVYTPTREAAAEVFNYFKRRISTQRSETAQGEASPLSAVDQVVGIHSFLPSPAQQARNVQVLKGWTEELDDVDPSELPEELATRWPQIQKALRAQPFSLGDLPADYRAPFESLSSAKHQGFLTYVYSGVDLWDGRFMIQFADQVGEIEVESGTYHAAGMPLIFSLLAKIILRDGQLTVLLTFAFLLLILALDLRRFSDVLVALAPLVLGVGSMLGVMSLVDAHLNLMNIVVFPIIIGYGVSHGVYLLHRVREGATPREALSSVGRAIACSTLTTLAGWAALLAAPHRGLQSMGTLACLGMIASLLVSFTLMPALLELMRRRAQRI